MARNGRTKVIYKGTFISKQTLDREAHKEDFESHSVNAYNTNLNLNGGDLRTGTL